MAEERTDRTVTPKLVLIAILLLIIVVLAVVNSEDTRVDLLMADATTPLFVVIVVSALIGWVMGWFSGRRRD